MSRPSFPPDNEYDYLKTESIKREVIDKEEQQKIMETVKVKVRH